MLPPFSGLKNKPSKRNASKQVAHVLSVSLSVPGICFQAGFLLGLFFDPEDGGDMFLQNIG
jgi:hypothetical protein